VLADLGAPTQPALGCDPDNIYGHSAEPSDDGRLVFLAYWDSAFVALDLTDPTEPEFLGNTTYPANADGDAHSSNYDDARELLFTADEDFCKTSGPATEKGLGYLRVYDYSDVDAPVQIGEFRTPNSLGTDDRAAGDYTIHNPFLVGETLYVSWYSDGVRVFGRVRPNRSDGGRAFRAASGQEPGPAVTTWVLTNTAQVWGVVVDGGLVFASDMNSGLWILRRT
jgi:hypothetical protein